MLIKFFSRIEQPSVKNWIWFFPSLSYVDFYEVKGVYLSWLQWDIVAIEWYK